MATKTFVIKEQNATMGEELVIHKNRRKDRERMKRAMELQDRIRKKFGNLRLSEEVRKWREAI